MPTYVYRCVACRNIEELDLSMGYQPEVLECVHVHEEPVTTHPMRRVYGTFSTTNMPTEAGKKMGRA